ncbi:MAG: hypothetical protein HY608_09370, partial [Planctomycetes bacterium]|nr:hypothetical protein [Planctomycetota bacterium]
PMISLEGRRFWVLGLMPLSRTGILRSKFVLSSAAAVLVSGSLICLSDRMLDVPGWMMALHAGMVILVGLGLSGLSVGLGAMFPDFRTDNPSRIVSSFGGTLNLLLGLAYLLGVTALMALPVCLREVPRLFGSYGLSDLTFGAGLACASAASLLLTGLATWVPLRLGEKALERAEL